MPVTPSAAACARPVASKLSHTMAPAGMPLFQSLAASSKLPEVQEPHIPTPASATWTSFAISTIRESGAGAMPVGFRQTRIVAAG